MNRHFTLILHSVVLSICFAVASAEATTLFPTNGAKDVCADSPLRITFDAPPTIGTGQIKVMDATSDAVVQTIDLADKTAEQTIGRVPHFKYFPVIVSGNDAAIYLPNGSLAYNKTYYVTVDAGGFKNDGGVTGKSDWRFTTKSAAPAAGTAKLNIAADGSGDFCTVQAALDWVPDGNTTRTTLFLHKGTYTELIDFRNKHEITITGEDRKQSVIAYANNANFNPSSEQGYHRGVFLAANCKDLVISNLTMRNTTPHGGSQAETIILNGNTTSKAIIANVDLYSFQDTLQINGQAYISNCYIEGDVDFIWGNGPCYFENCHCYGTRSKAYYAQIRNPATNHGYVFHRCIFDGPDGVTGMYLNRIAPATFPHSEMVLMDCQLGPAVAPVGWLLNSAVRGQPAPATAPDIHLWEYNSHGADGKPIDLSKRLNVSRELKAPDDAETIKNYLQPSFVLGNNWDAPSDPNLP